ncbi:uncharacterized protein OCT59_010104 [Rhizophagus irregularis]|uniref:F-box domain-containing protein n=2 Tax=Rhizophagus irregularis TaxID=588596 RepID=U9U1X1_RHIID|nr:hypothetical protein GLOIN_2v1545940 [Rhizophagus irregularis DAOM 181602=DAOM 197198]EXX60331.1 hypothetical protein RirG_180860 [Rhizophagus irregularis DAOM 197198w]POG77596.1 hypothetical protein GLOIN_2v1545940 [Rhizophagus irregularis DAOM 181602=DAOM 197198]UZO18794.1 hypothetical protein OCT59_010104 [Rhizophagus irregularis]GBC38803.2 hypothetical protein GLOIN_2v1545940 [Rhizophagus irregularis DAOM 181602=DAOM 197198]|eukprot:XP_025184462.1 hypothetical protein GLOIN_2v1545940 [Rhizophagus irregularis DAOM 181602=DAOM 197198]
MSRLIADCLIIIFNDLREKASSLYSCILVNRYWCRTAMPILWKVPFEFDIGNWDSLSNRKLYNLIFYLLPTFSKKLLLDNNIELPTIQEFSNQPLFNYISFSSQVPPNFINNMINNLIKKEDGFNKYKETGKKYLLEQEIYKLFINNCKDIKYFNWQTTQPLSQFHGAPTCFSQLRSLIMDLDFVTSRELFAMSQICQNIEELSIFECYDDIPGLIWFIDTQKILRSLYLHFKSFEKQCLGLSEVIERKASTLRKFSIEPWIISLSPKFLPSLINLQHLELKNFSAFNVMDIFRESEWEVSLSLASFPNLQYLETVFLPFSIECDLIEKSNGNILDIDICRMCNQDPNYTKKLIKAISTNCPNIERLIIEVELEDLHGIKEILINCSRLIKLNLSINNEDELECDEILKIIVKFSPETLHEITFCANFIFTLDGLIDFFENWKGRKPLIFYNL